MNKQKTILATAYAINPYKGSEDGMGWNFVLQIARFNKVLAITRENNRVHIEKYMTEKPDERYANVSFIYFDLPYWMRFWKRSGQFAMLYFWMWQYAIPGFVKKKNLLFDIAHNLNFHNDWTPSYLWKLKKPFVWGPIGHHPKIERGFMSSASVLTLIKEEFTWLIKKLFWNFSPALKKTVRSADHIICMNSEVEKSLVLTDKKYSLIPSVACEDFGFIPHFIKDEFVLLSAGRLVALKGFDLTILSFADFLLKLPKEKRSICKLIIVGSGPEKDKCMELAAVNGVEEYVTFIEWISRTELMQLYKKSSAFLFPSHEGAGMVVAEAFSFGLPVICLDNSGPGEFIDKDSGMAVKAKDTKEAVMGLSKAISVLFEEPKSLQWMSLGARRRFESYFHWDSRGEKLKEIYSNL